MRTRPEALPRFSTATRIRAARRPLSCRLPRRPACSPPTHVSSTSTSPCNGSRAAFHHRSAEFVKHHPGSLITGQAELPLQEQGGHTALIGGHQIGGPKPMRQGNFSPVKNSPGGQRDLVSTGSTLPPSLVHQFIGSSMSASRTDEAIGPATGRQVLLASLVCGEVGLKLVYCLRKRRSGHLFTLPIGAC